MMCESSMVGMKLSAFLWGDLYRTLKMSNTAEVIHYLQTMAKNMLEGMRLKKILLVAAILFVAYTFFYNQHSSTVRQTPPLLSEQNLGKSEAAVADAFAKHKSNVQVSGEGIVTRLLPDDNDGSRHQRFIVELSSGHTLLIAHNIDLAPRISALKKGDSVRFYGEYEWNKKGGVLHWTHRDPNGSHIDGWLQHQNKMYQ